MRIGKILLSRPGISRICHCTCHRISTNGRRGKTANITYVQDCLTIVIHAIIKHARNNGGGSCKGTWLVIAITTGITCRGFSSHTSHSKAAYVAYGSFAQATILYSSSSRHSTYGKCISTIFSCCSVPCRDGSSLNGYGQGTYVASLHTALVIIQAPPLKVSIDSNIRTV